MKPLFVILLVLAISYSKAQNLEDNKIRFNGTYSLYSSDTVNWKIEALWTHLKPFEGFSNQDRTGNLFVTIELIDEKHIAFTLLRNDSMMSKKILSYKLKGDSSLIIRKPKNKVSKGVPFVYYTRRAEKLILTTNQLNNLIVDYDGDTGAMVFIVAFGVPIKGTREFKKLKQ